MRHLRSAKRSVTGLVPVAIVLAALLLGGCKNADPTPEARTTTSETEHGSHLAPPQMMFSQVRQSGPGPKVGDRWRASVALNVCGQFLNPPAGDTVRGVTPNADGTVDIAPTNAGEAGHFSTLGAYIESVGAKLSTGSLGLPASITPAELTVRDATVPIAGATFTDGAECAGVKGKVAVWVYSREAVKTGNGLVVVVEDPQEVPFFEDGSAFVITFTPESSLPTLPPSAAINSGSTSGN